MKLAIMQPYFFPYIGYWQLLNLSDVFVVYDDVDYIKQGYINRNTLLINGERKYFTLQTIGAGSNTKIMNVGVGTNAKKLLKTISQNYSKSPFFEETYPLIEDILTNDEKNLSRFLLNSLKLVFISPKINILMIIAITALIYVSLPLIFGLYLIIEPRPNLLSISSGSMSSMHFIPALIIC